MSQEGREIKPEEMKELYNYDENYTWDRSRRSEEDEVLCSPSCPYLALCKITVIK